MQRIGTGLEATGCERGRENSSSSLWVGSTGTGNFPMAKSSETEAASYWLISPVLEGK